MKGRPDQSKKQLREVDNNTALGGMRNPNRSVHRIANAQQAGATIATFLTECINLNPRLLQPVTAILQGAHSIGFKPSNIFTIKEYTADLMQAGTPLAGPGLDPAAFKMWTDASGDPDIDLPRWLETGAPLGILHPVTSRGIFPPVDTVAPTPESISALASSPDDWENYRSSEDDPNTTHELLQTMVDKGWAQVHPTWEN